VTPLPDPRAGAFAAQPIPLAIVHEDEALIVVDKPAGLVVHPGSGNWDGTLANALLHHCPQLALVARAGIVHRLDKDTSGLLVVAKTDVAQTDLVRQLQARTVRREYLALANGDIVRGGVVDAPIGRHPVKRTSMAVVSTGKAAVTRYEVRERFGDCTLLVCRLETGRTHQIRVHLTSIGHPLVGDPQYRGPRNHAFGRQALHAWRLGLVHPVTHIPAQWESPLPADFAGLLATLRERAKAQFA
jgi:23S rRNA pseudouridine1911/1915/1917 synthase